MKPTQSQYDVPGPKLKALPTDTLKKLMDADALGLAYAQMLSMGSVGNLFVSPVGVAAAAAAAAPAKSSEKRVVKKVE